jgi:hypothetical protein
VIIILLEIPLLLTTYIYSSKSKEILTTVSSLHPSRQESLTTNHLLDQEDQFVKLKIVQLNLVRYAFIVTFVLHTIELACYYVGDEEIICVTGSSGIQVTNSLELYILSVENVSELFPHFIIPFIFWFIPAKMNRTAKTLYVRVAACR